MITSCMTTILRDIALLPAAENDDGEEEEEEEESHGFCFRGLVNISPSQL